MMMYVVISHSTVVLCIYYAKLRCGAYELDRGKSFKNYVIKATVERKMANALNK